MIAFALAVARSLAEFVEDGVLTVVNPNFAHDDDQYERKVKIVFDAKKAKARDRQPA